MLKKTFFISSIEISVRQSVLKTKLYLLFCIHNFLQEINNFEFVFYNHHRSYKKRDLKRPKGVTPSGVVDGPASASRSGCQLGLIERQCPSSTPPCCTPLCVHYKRCHLRKNRFQLRSDIFIRAAELEI